jgi:hypothetical protein
MRPDHPCGLAGGARRELLKEALMLGRRGRPEVSLAIGGQTGETWQSRLRSMSQKRPLNRSIPE